MAEYLEIFDENNQSLGFTKLRRQVHKDGNWHRTAQIYILNSRKELLCNLRNPLKEVFPSLWDLSIGGHLDPGETYEQAAIRELEEELNLLVKPVDLLFLSYMKIDGKDELADLLDREHSGIFIYHTDKEATEFKYQTEEIIDLQFFTIAYLKQNLKSIQPQLPIVPLQAKFLATLEMIELKLNL